MKAIQKQRPHVQSWLPRSSGRISRGSLINHENPYEDMASPNPHSPALLYMTCYLDSLRSCDLGHLIACLQHTWILPDQFLI